MPSPSLTRNLLLALGALVLATTGGLAQETAALDTDAPVEAAALEMPQVALGASSKLPLPRYVSLKSGRVNLRIGPGRDYPVTWLYLKAGLPVEIVQEFDLWRRIRDSEGTEGWVYHSLLSGERTSIAAPWLKGKAAVVDVHTSPAADAPLVAQMEPGVVSSVRECNSGWCEVEVERRRGFVRQPEIWGVYPDERF